jgi:succinylarginine dihydrolase
LRLRVVLTDTQIARAHQGVFLTDSLYERLVRWVKQHYRDRLHADDLADPKLAEESHTALNELTDTLQLGSLYPFQR